MRKQANPYIPLNESDLHPHRSDPAYLALDELNGFVREVLTAQRRPHDLGELQGPLAELAEELVELASGGMTLRAYRRRCDAALRACREAKSSLPQLVKAQAMSAAQSLEIARQLDEIIARVTKQWIAVQPEEPDDEAASQNH